MRLNIAASGFDILAAADELRDAGFDENQTRAINDIHRTAREELAIKSDIDTLKAERTAPRAEVRADPCRALWVQGVGIIAILTAPRFVSIG